MVCATRFFVLLSTPFPLVRLSRHHHKLFLSPSLLSSSSFHNLTSHSISTPLLLLPHSSSSSPINSSNHHHRLHNQAASSLRTDYLGDPSLVHPWPEWSNFIQHLSASGYFHHPPPDDDFLAAAELTHLFIREARACLAFARDRKNIFRFVFPPPPLRFIWGNSAFKYWPHSCVLGCFPGETLRSLFNMARRFSSQMLRILSGRWGLLYPILQPLWVLSFPLLSSNVGVYYCILT